MYCLFVSIICLIFLVVRYLNIFCSFVSKYLIAFSLYVINVFMNCFGSFFIAYSNLSSEVFICSGASFIYVKFTSRVWNVFRCFFIVIVAGNNVVKR